MKDVTLPLRTGYFNLLNNMVVDGRQIPVFDMHAPAQASAPYVIIGEIFSKSNNTKDTFGSEVVIDLLAYSEYKGDFGGRQATDLIADKILNLVIPAPGKSGVSATGFGVTMAKHVGSSDENDYGATGNKYRKRVTIEHTIWES